ncbi:hypothetical protein JMA_06870 [Jeotgalibacillus malaysiensis]|uniref:Uncharacterized protein n=1 Tax=Jeotgalibacillus malaysiensis TaxID=1508404 RepID=A0A0B5API9_9BACL|nr:hypothetical protein JMA_06870 [Jeotgalibacillus malaysiensis]
MVQEISTGVPEINKAVHEIMPFNLHNSPTIYRKKIRIPGN